MTPNAFALAQRTAGEAVSFTRALARDLADVAHALRCDDAQDGLASLSSGADRLQRFLTFVVVSAELLHPHAPAAGVVLLEYNHRVLATLARVQASLARVDLDDLATLLDHDLAALLLEYELFAGTVERAFGHRAAAA